MTHVRSEDAAALLWPLGVEERADHHDAFSTEDAPPPSGDDSSLDEAARDEREYVRHRLRDELQREPSEEEVDEWLRHHTEGY